MTVLFTCPNCGAVTEVDDEYLGQTGPCYCCGKSVTVPHIAPDGAQTKPRRASGAATGMVMAIVFVAAIAMIGVTALMFWVARPLISTLGQPSHQTMCENNLAQIVLAMQSYHDDHGSFPPAYIADENGKPMHSWRVLLLPYLEQDWLYQQYDFSKPWNSPENSALAQQLPSVYGCPADPDARSNGETSYMVIVGGATMFPGSKSTKRSDIVDGSANTIMVVEVTASVPWTQPKDLTVDLMQFEVNGPFESEIGSHHTGGAVVATADGTTHLIPDNTPSEYIEALISIQGGETVTPDELSEFR